MNEENIDSPTVSRVCFSELNLKPQILEAVQKAGYENPSPIQERAIPPLLEGSDFIGVAQTGTGKTAAFSLPLLSRIDDNTISSKIAKDLFSQMLTSDETADEMIEMQGLEQITDEDSITQFVTEVLDEFSEQKDQYLAGKEQVLGFLVGQVMKRSKGKANPKLVNELIIRQIKG